MAKLITIDLVSGAGSHTAINNNFSLVETAVENTLSRDGTSPNSMLVQFDMGLNRIINLANASSPQDAISKSQLDAASSLVTIDASTSTYTQGDTGSVSRTIENRLQDYVSIKDFGAVGDGIADDTAAFNNLLAFPGLKYISKPSSKYKIDAIAFSGLSDMYIYIEPGTIIEANTGFAATDQLFNFIGSNNIAFDAPGGATFQMLKAEYTTGEDRDLFRIMDCSDIWINGITAKDSGGDGFNVGLRSAFAERVYVTNCVSDNNRRNGVSITAGKDIFFVNHLSKTSTGTSPQAGYDIEPNADPITPTQTEGPLENIHLISCRSLSNVGVGFQYSGGDDLTQIGDFSIYITNCESNGDAINFQVGGGDPTGTQAGIVEFTGCHGLNADGNGLAIKGSNMPVVWTGGMIMNPNQASNANDRDGSAVSIFSVNGTDGQDIGNVSVKGLKVRDPDGNMNKTVSMQLVSEATSTYSDIDLEIDAKDVAATKRTFMGTVGSLAPIAVKYTDDPEFATTVGIGSSSTPLYLHQRITNEGASGSINFQINTTVSQVNGATFDFEVVAAQTMFITSDAGNHFFPDNRISMASNQIGAKLRVEWDGAVWQITKREGVWSIVQTFSTSDATPSIALGEIFKTADTTTYTDFNDSRGDHHTFKLLALHAATVTNGANIKTSTGGNKTLLVNVIYEFTSIGGVWYEQATGVSKTETVTTTNVITAAETDKTFYLNAVGGFTSTLPAPADGLKYTFIVKTAPTTAYIITTNSGDNILYGTFLDIVGELVYFSAQDTLNFVASTSLIGDRLEVESDGTNWYCKAFSGADGGISVSVT